MLHSWQRVQVIQAAPEVRHRCQNVSASFCTDLSCAAAAAPPAPQRHGRCCEKCLIPMHLEHF